MILLTGGTGYIGSHTAVELLKAGYEIVLADDLSNSRADVVERIARITGVQPRFYNADVRDGAAVERIFAENEIEAVLHFAGFKAVAESTEKPLAYYRNNLDTTLTLLETMQRHGCRRFVFSSSATVYGEVTPPFVETMPEGKCANPYGRSKLMIEQILTDATVADPTLSVAILRYFNPIGADESGLLCEQPNGIPNNLMPHILRVAAGEREQLSVFGDDYPTPDGSCLRDYIHVSDLALGHLAALDYTAAHGGAEVFNLGTGRAYSVLEVVHAFEKATGVAVPYVIAPRRAGDVAEMQADPGKAQCILGWRAQRTLEDMCRDAWRAAQYNP